VPGKRPINADAPTAEIAVPAPPEPPATAPPKPEPPAAASPKPEPPAAASPKPEPEAPRRPRLPRARRPRLPGALKLVLALFLVAIAFIVAAVVGGGGGSQQSSAEPGAPAPVGPRAGSEAQAPAAEAASQLGYPAFATKNTTRVGGSDPASTAAAVALATFPATTEEQRPSAVTLVGEEDWRGAIAASVLMAPPLRAPILFSGGDVPDPTSEALAALDPNGDPSSGGARAFAIGGVATPGDLGRVTSVEAGSGAAEAAAIAALRDRLFGSPPDHLVVASSAEPAMAMPAAAWAARSGDPVLFSGAKSLPKPTAEALRRHPMVPVYVLGPSSAISSGVFREIAKIDGRVHRVSGEDPASNAIALARYAVGGFGWNVNDPGHGMVIARSDEPLAAAAAAPLSASGTWGPLLLTEGAATLPTALREYLLDIKPGYVDNPTRAFYNHVWIVGDPEAISVSQQAEIDALAELAKIGGEK
jgi:hypothetical protein